MDPIIIVLIVLIGLIFLVGVGFLVFYIKNSKVDKNQSEAIRDLERRITDLMTQHIKELRGSVDNTSQAMHKQISSFTKETVQVREDLKQVQKAMEGIASSQEIFINPKLRGQWGEQSLKHILSQHFPKELYEVQYLFSSGEQVDAVIKLPNDKLLPIDAKFPSVNFEKMKEAEREEEKKKYRKKFVGDVKHKIDKIAEKYILPSEGTLDYAIMYIPAEAIYYEIILREAKLLRHAQSKKVTLASPNTFYSALRTIEHWFRNMQISRKTEEIIRRLNRIQQDSAKLKDNFRKLGNHLKNASSAYESSEKRLSLLGRRVEKLAKIKENKKLKGDN